MPAIRTAGPAGGFHSSFRRLATAPHQLTNHTASPAHELHHPTSSPPHHVYHYSRTHDPDHAREVGSEETKSISRSSSNAHAASPGVAADANVGREGSGGAGAAAAEGAGGNAQEEIDEEDLAREMESIQSRIEMKMDGKG